MNVVESIQQQFLRRVPLADIGGGAPPLPPVPDVELSATEVLGLGGKPWKSPHELASVVQAREKLKAAEADLAKLESDLATARGASSAKPSGPEELAAYLQHGRPPGRDKDAQANAERAAALQGLLPVACEAVKAAKEAGSLAWSTAPAEIWASEVEPEWKKVMTEVAAALCRLALAQLALRSLQDRFTEHWRRYALAAGKVMHTGFHANGVRVEGAVFDGLLHGRAPMPNIEVLKFLDCCKAEGLIQFQPLDDVRALYPARVNDAALRAVHELLKAVAAQGGAGPEPQPEKKGG
jgi:hypothetical protein